MVIDSLTFVVPTYRTADTLTTLVDRIAATAPDIADGFEIIVVDDACPDRSGRLVAGRPGVRVLRSETNRGQRTAVLTGLAVAESSAVCVMDADLQDDPGDVGALIDFLERADVVCAGRRGEHQSAARRGQAWAFRRARWLATRGAVPPDAGLFHVARTAAVRAMLVRAVPGDDPLVLYARTGARIASIPVQRHRRPTGRSGYSTATRAAMAAATVRSLASPPPHDDEWPTFHEIEATEQK